MPAFGGVMASNGYSTGVAVIGIGESDIGKSLGRSSHSLYAQAINAAIKDAGLEKSQIDGLVTIWASYKHCQGMPHSLYSLVSIPLISGLHTNWKSIAEQIFVHPIEPLRVADVVAHQEKGSRCIAHATKIDGV